MSQDQERPFASSVIGSDGGFINKNKKILLAAAAGLTVVLAGYILSGVNFSSAPEVSAQDLIKNAETAKMADAAAQAEKEKALRDAEAQKAAALQSPAMPGDAQASVENTLSPAGPVDSTTPGAPSANAAISPATNDPAKSERIESLEREVEDVKAELGELKKNLTAYIRAQNKRVTEPNSVRPRSSESSHLPHLATLGSGAYINATPDKINLLSGGREIEVRAGQRFPNGSTYIGFDRKTQVVKTDQGDYRVN